METRKIINLRIYHFFFYSVLHLQSETQPLVRSAGLGVSLSPPGKKVKHGRCRLWFWLSVLVRANPPRRVGTWGVALSLEVEMWPLFFFILFLPHTRTRNLAPCNRNQSGFYFDVKFTVSRQNRLSREIKTSFPQKTIRKPNQRIQTEMMAPINT